MAVATKMKNEKTEALLEALEQGILGLTSSQRWADWLRSQARFHRYSFGNVLLIAAQRPDAQQVAGFHTWKAVGRRVVKGAKGIAILAPHVRKVTAEDENGDEVTGRVLRGFGIAYVFDVADTDGEPLPTVVRQLQGDGLDIWRDLETLASELEFHVSRDPIEGAANGYCDFTHHRIVVRPDISGAQACKTFVHELAHALLHGDAPVNDPLAKPILELEAESTAFAVCQAIGLDSSDYSFGYLAVWGGQSGKATVDAIRRSAARIQGAVHQILDAIEVVA